MPKIVLVVDDDPVQRRVLNEAIERFGYAVETAGDGDAALAALRTGDSGEIALVLLDLAMPGTGARDVLSAMQTLTRKVPVIVQTDQGNIDAATWAMGLGAADFVVKPVGPERLEVSIKNALKIEALAGEINRIKGSAGGELSFADLIAGSETMTRVIALGRRAAASNSPVLLEGEDGTGKELIARAIHGESARKESPFVAVNCGTVPEHEIGSLLFGQAGQHTSKVEDAQDGTLFLDEIGELPLKAQARLMRLLQDGVIDGAARNKPVKANVRLISATNKNLIGQVEKGRFREDLYYRLNVFPISMPPLRMRLEDMPELVRRFTARFAAEEGKRIDGIGAEAAAMLQRYGWPGNIRQLENAVFRAVVLADTPMLTVNEFPQIAAHVVGYAVRVPPAPAPKDSALPLDGPVMLGQSATTPAMVRVPAPGGKASLGITALSESGDIRSLDAVEADMIRLAFSRYRGRMTEIAKRLGIGRSTLYRKMREIGLETKPHEPCAKPIGRADQEARNHL